MRSDDLRARLADLEPDTAADEVLADQAIATLALIERLEDDIATNGVAITGARGQVVANPSLAAIAKQRAVLERLLVRLFPPEESRGTRAARHAARARWGHA